LPLGTKERWRPLVPLRILGPSGLLRSYIRAVLDSGADDTVLPMDVALIIGVATAPAAQRLRWRGQTYSLQFGAVELELEDQTGMRCRWRAVVGFSPAPIRYPILGQAGCLQFFDAMFRGLDRVVELETNRAYPGITS
jgi:hypothetical protein